MDKAQLLSLVAAKQERFSVEDTNSEVTRPSSMDINGNEYSHVFLDRRADGSAIDVEHPYPMSLAISTIERLSLSRTAWRKLLFHDPSEARRFATYLDLCLQDISRPEWLEVFFALHPAGDPNTILSLAAATRRIQPVTPQGGPEEGFFGGLVYTCSGSALYTPMRHRGQRYGMVLMAAVGAMCTDEFIHLLLRYTGDTPIQATLVNHARVYTELGNLYVELRSEVMRARWQSVAAIAPSLFKNVRHEAFIADIEHWPENGLFTDGPLETGEDLDISAASA